MSWLSSSWQHRIPVLCNNLVASTSPIDVIATLPPELSAFWANIQSAGEDVRVTDSDGRTLLTFDLSNAAGSGAFSSANRDGRLELQGVAPPAQNCMFVVWLYFGNAGASSALTTFTPSTPRNGYVSPYLPSGDVLTYRRPDGGKTKPPAGGLAITTDEILHPWVMVDRALWGLSEKYEGRTDGEEIDYIVQEVLNGGADDSGRYSEDDIRMVGRGAIMANVDGTALTDGTDYTLSLQVATTEGRIINPRFLVQCRDVDEG